MIQIADSTLHLGDALTVLKSMPADTVQCCVTSPPYYLLRDYRVEGQIGLEKTPGEFIQRLVEVFEEVRRILRPDGTLWVNMGDSYAQTAKGQAVGGKSTLQGTRRCHDESRAASVNINRVTENYKRKDLLGIPWRLAFALQDAGWWLRRDIIWHKPSPLPESVVDRPTTAHEYMFLLSKSQRYFYDTEASKEPVTGKAHLRVRKSGQQETGKTPKGLISPPEVKGANRFYKYTTDLVETRNLRSVWTIPPEPFPCGHFAVYPRALVRPCLLAGTQPGSIVLDPFMGAGTTGLVAVELDCPFWGIELNPEYFKIAVGRIGQASQQQRLKLNA